MVTYPVHQIDGMSLFSDPTQSVCHNYDFDFGSKKSEVMFDEQEVVSNQLNFSLASTLVCYLK